MARQLIVTRPRVAELMEYEVVPPKADEVLVQVYHASPKHGTDLGDFRGTSPFVDEYFDETMRLFKPREEKGTGVKYGEWNVGNMWVGRIVEKGSEVRDYASGDWVCSYGGIREFHTVNAVNNYRLRKMAGPELWKNAVCYDPAQFALGGVRDSGCRPGDAVAVFGLGAIGLIAVQLCSRIGAEVIAIDPIEKRRQAAKSLGADKVIDPAGNDTGYMLKELTGGMGVDCMIETSGSAYALSDALRGLAYGGRISYVAFAKEFKGGLNFGREAHFNNASIVFSRAGSEPNPDYPRFSRRRIEDVCWNMLMNGHLTCDCIIDPVVGLEDCAEAYMKYVDREPELSIKLGIDVIQNKRGDLK